MHILSKDQKWAWRSVVGGFISCSIYATVDLSYSIIFKEIKSFYSVNSTIASSIFGLLQAFRLIISPIVVLAINAFGCDKVSMSGGVIIALALFISSSSPNIIIFMISYCVIAGCGVSFCYTSLLVILSENFDKNKSMAFGIALSGVSFGYIIFPHMFALVIIQYEFRSALMLLSAFTLNMVPAGLFYRKIINSNDSNIEMELNEKLIKESYQISNLHEPDDVNKHQSKIYLYTKQILNKNVIWFNIGICWYLVGVIPWSIFIVDFVHSIKEMNLNIAVLTFTMEGISQIVARISSGYIFDKSYFRPYRGIVCSICSFLTGFSCILLVIITPSIYSYMFISMLRGFSLGVFITQNVIALGDICNPLVLSMTIGLLSFMKGVGSLIGSTLSGFVRDNFSSYFETFMFLAVNQIFSSLLILVPFVRQLMEK